jgi:lipoprotein NlpI
LALRREYADDRVALCVYLGGMLHVAADDLYRLNPHDAPDPRALFLRFLAWAPRRVP